MRRKLTVMMVTVLMLGAGIPVAAEESDEWEPVLTRQPVFFTCEDAAEAAKVWNVSRHAAGAIGWRTTPPDGSVFDGAGCVSLDVGPWAGPVRDAVNTLTFRGEYTGNLDRLTFSMYALSMGEPEADWPVQFGVTVNGEEIIPFPTEVVQNPTGTNSGVSDTTYITVTDIGLLDEADNTTHEVEIRFGYDDTFRLTSWVWDTTEAPSGVDFNAHNLRGPQLPAQR